MSTQKRMSFVTAMQSLRGAGKVREQEREYDYIVTVLMKNETCAGRTIGRRGTLYWNR